MTRPLLAACALVALTLPAGAADPTFHKDVAPILFARCATCHRDGQIGPFPLLKYADAKTRAKQIARVTADRTMPPWKPDAGHGEFRDARTLTDKQLAALKDWAAAGAPEGDPKDAPPAPKFTDGWQLGKPDIVLKMAEPFTVPAEGRDIYQHFVFPLDLKKDVHVVGVECRPGNPKVAHHAVGLLDDRPGIIPRTSDPAVAFLVHRLHHDPRAAAADVRAARALTGPDATLPAVGAALAAGDITRAHADVAVRTVARMPARLFTTPVPDDPDTTPGQVEAADADRPVRTGLQVADTWLAEQARTFPVASTQRLADALVAVLDPDHAARYDEDGDCPGDG